MYGIIYLCTNLINNKKYVGQTIQSLEVRKQKHYYSAFELNLKRYFYNALRKYGCDNFKWEIIFVAKDKTELDEKEKYYIKYYNTYIYDKDSWGYNMTIGGEGSYGFKHSEESKIKMKNFHKGKKLSKEHIRKVIEKTRGENKFNSKLTNKEVEEIKLRLINKERVVDIVKDYYITESIIYDIKRCVIWSHIRPDLNEELKDSVSKLGTHQEQKIRRNKIISLLNNGLTNKEISDIMNMDYFAVASIICKYRKKNNIKVVNKNEDRDKDIIMYFKEGKTRKEICEILNLEINIINGVIGRYKRKTNINYNLLHK